MVVHEGIMEQPNIVGRWSEALKALHGRIAHRFARSEARERIRRYLLGQLGRVERKNGSQLAEAIGEADPQGVHRLLNSAKWDATLVRDDLREYVVEHLGDEESVGCSSGSTIGRALVCVGEAARMEHLKRQPPC